MPVMDGHDTIKLLNKNYPEIKVIIVSSYFDKLNILDFFSRGASAYISKKYTVEKLIDAVLSVYYNGVYTANLPTEILDSLSCTSSKKGEVKLTPTELKIVKVLFKSHSSEQASKIIGCAKRTVEWHRSNILSKTKCKSIEDLKKLFDEDLINLV
jgi:DNA-binding NarL/FixJ family response regulator